MPFAFLRAQAAQGPIAPEKSPFKPPSALCESARAIVIVEDEPLDAAIEVGLPLRHASGGEPDRSPTSPSPGGPSPGGRSRAGQECDMRIPESMRPYLTGTLALAP
jgi:hypothetical protein